jgi:hypothetical protein
MSISNESSLPEQLLREAGKTKSRTPLHPKPNPYVKTFNHWVRRIHLYSGLLLLPWVFLYGVTGFLFNHPSFFASSDSTFFGPSETRGTPLEQIPTPAESAARLLTSINQTASPPYELVDDTAAYKSGLRATFTAENGRNMALTLDPHSLGGNVRPFGAARTIEAEGKKEAPFEQKKLALEVSPKELLTEAVPKILANIGYTNTTKLKPEMPALTFKMRGGEETWLVTYNEGSGNLTGERVRESDAPTMPFRQFLLRLHLTHHYPSEFGIRWVYAVVVDVMSLTMLFWGVSGVIMWLQIKRTRVLGALLLLLALVSVAAIGPLMYEAIVSAGR